MQYYNLTADLYFKEGITLCLGMFDGMHLGHQSIIDKARNLGHKIAVLELGDTALLNKKNEFLNSSCEKEILYEMFNIDLVIKCDFVHALKNLTPHQFVENVLKLLNVINVVVGEDFRFGKDASGNTSDLVKFCLEIGINVVVLPLLIKDNTKISTSNIIKLIQNGDINHANSLLGYNYFVSGKVVKGQEKGRILGFRTANIEFGNHQVIPRLGVYYALITIDGVNHHAMVNVGVHPTMGKLKKPMIEAHIFNFDEDIYNQKIIIWFCKFIRDEQKFTSEDELIEQLNRDKNKILCLMLKK